MMRDSTNKYSTPTELCNCALGGLQRFHVILNLINSISGHSALTLNGLKKDKEHERGSPTAVSLHRNSFITACFSTADNYPSHPPSEFISSWRPEDCGSSLKVLSEVGREDNGIMGAFTASVRPCTSWPSSTAVWASYREVQVASSPLFTPRAQTLTQAKGNTEKGTKIKV